MLRVILVFHIADKKFYRMFSKTNNVFISSLIFTVIIFTLADNTVSLDICMSLETIYSYSAFHS